MDNGYFVTWPGFTNKLISKHLIDTIPTTKCHQNQDFQSLQIIKYSNYNTTLKAIRAKFKQLKNDILEGKSFKDVFEAEIMNDLFPKSPTPNVKRKEVVHAIVDLNDLVAYGDLTGKFAYRWSRGNQ